MHRFLSAVLAAVVLACASSGKAPKSRVDPPQLLTRTRPDLQVQPGARTGRALDIRLEVLVDETGQADLKTVRLTGVGASENEAAIRTWLQQVRFRPGRRQGVPAAVVFTSRWTAEVRAVRIQ